MDRHKAEVQRRRSIMRLIEGVSKVTEEKQAVSTEQKGWFDKAHTLVEALPYMR